jgi:hypothetical protein
VDSPDRLENGRLWVSRGRVSSRRPFRESVYSSPGAASYGASYDENFRSAFMRVGTQVIAIDPYAAYGSDGFQDFRRASNLWLKENGYVLSVRTHVNPMYHYSMDDAYASAETGSSNELPLPRATIKLNKQEDEENERLRAGIDELRDGDVVHKPDWAVTRGPAMSWDEWIASRDVETPEVASADEETDSEDGA